jgi:hypothetical protein
LSRAFFDQVAEALVGFLPPERTEFSCRASSRNLKVWFGPEAREHYEVQLVPAGMAGRPAGRGGKTQQGRGPVLEVGFHAEHPDAGRNQEVIGRLLAGEPGWRDDLGAEVEAGAFLGRSGWRRVSEVWEGADLEGPEAAVEAADRLALYICALEPLRSPCS